MSRNFRTNYILSLGVQANKPLQLLLEEEIIDVSKLRSILAKLILPNEYRMIVWKILLGITPTCRQAWPFVEKQHEEMFQDVKRFCSIIQCGRYPEDLKSSDEQGAKFSPSQRQSPKHLLQMYMTYHQSYHRTEVKLSEAIVVKMMTIFSRIIENECEAYFSFSKFLNYFYLKDNVCKTFLSILFHY